jgi:excisionase family DNA binding protein
MASYNAILTLARAHPGGELADQVHGSDLDAYHAVTATDDRGRAQIIITVTAENLSQATVTARGALAGFDDPVALTVMTTAEYDRADDVIIPELLTITEAAQRLNITRQAVQRRIDRGTLPARQFGRQWAISAHSIT